MSILAELKGKKAKNLPDTRFDARIKYLESQEIDVSIIQKGVNEVIKSLTDGADSLVVYGEPQSGKTEFMIALVCRLLDEGKKTIFVTVNDNTELEVQNFDRFVSAIQINPSPMKFEDFVELQDRDKKTDLQRIIFCRKNAQNLKKLIKEARFLKDRVVLDDEADYASPDTNKNKEDEDPSTINRLVSELGRLPPNGQGVYIGVTATPGRLDLNGTFANDSEHWVFLDSHKNYKGRKFFFPTSDEQEQSSDYILKLLPDDTGNESTHLKEAFLRFLVHVAVINLACGDKHNPTGYSMLIHTDGKTKIHEEDRKEIQKHLSIIQNEKQPKIDQYLEHMQKHAQEVIQRFQLDIDAGNVLNFILSYIGKSSTLIINHQKDKNNVRAACQPKDVFTFAMGGNIVSRGLTFENLLTFFFSRSVKGKFQQNTYIQRARMFGNRPYSRFFELCVPRELFGHWANCFADHEMSLRSAMAGDYVHISGGRTSSADSASIDKSSVINYDGEWCVGEVFKMPDSIEERFASDNRKRPIDLIEGLIKDNVIPESGFSSEMRQVIKTFSNNAQTDIEIVMSNKKSFFDIKNYQDRNEDNITRKKGGLVAGITKNRPELAGKAIILPVKNGGSGKMRFYYKNNLGKKVIKRVLDS